MALRVISLLRSNDVDFGVKRDRRRRRVESGMVLNLRGSWTVRRAIWPN